MAVLGSPSYTPFALSLVPDRDEVSVVVAGELDLASRGEVERAVTELTATGFDQIVLDLRDVEFIDAAGLRTLLGLRNDAQRNGHRLTFVAPKDGARRIFQLTGTRGLFAWR